MSWWVNASVCVCMCVCECMCVCVYMFMRVNGYVFVNECVFVSMHLLCFLNVCDCVRQVH